MNIIEATTSGFTNIINFKGRASRSEFWWCYLVITILKELTCNLLALYRYFNWNIPDL